MKEVPSPSLERAQEVAILALGHLASDTEQLGRFLALTGLGPAELRAQATEPGFLAGVLDYFSNHEPSLMAFCEACELDPQEVASARLKLGGGDPWYST